MNASKANLIYDLALSLLHVPYIFGGSNPSFGLDCSGLVIEILKSMGVLESKFDATALQLYQFPLFSKMDPPAQLGDLVFFGVTTKTITHVAFCLDRQFMLEAGGGHSTTLKRVDAYIQNARVRIRPIENRKDLIGFRRPDYGA